MCVSIMTPARQIRPPTLPIWLSPPPSFLFRQSKRATGKIEHTIRKHRLRRLDRVTNCRGGRAWRGRHYFRQRFTRALNHAHFTSHRGITIEADRWMASSRVSDSPSLLLLLPPSAASSTLFPRTAAMN